MNRLPWSSTAVYVGELSWAWVAGPPSPLKPRTPVPATVATIPSGLTCRMRLLPQSVMIRLPPRPTTTSKGALNCALAIGPPSPLKPATPVPATVVMIAVRPHLADPLVAPVRDVDGPLAVHRHPAAVGREVQLGLGRRPAVAAEARHPRARQRS